MLKISNHVMYLLVSNDVMYLHYSTMQPPTTRVGDIIIFRHYSIHLFIFAKNTLDLLQRPCILLADMHDYRTSGVSLHMCHMMSARIQGRSACKELQCEECELRHTFYFITWLFHHVGANISSTKMHSGPISLLLYHIILAREKILKVWENLENYSSKVHKLPCYLLRCKKDQQKMSTQKRRIRAKGVIPSLPHFPILKIWIENVDAWQSLSKYQFI